MSLDLALLNATTGLRLLDRQMARTADDIANADTEGHTRKILRASAFAPAGTGMGVRAMVATRDIDPALQAAEARARAQVAAATLRVELLTGIEMAHGTLENGDSLGGLVAELRTSLVALRNAPADAARQSDVVRVAEDVATRLNSLSSAISSARQTAQDTLRTEVEVVNATLAEIADLTKTIQRELAAGRSIASLEDKRDAAIVRLSESLDVQTIRRGDGSITLIAGGGLVLPLDGTPAFSIADATVAPGSWYGSGGTLPGIMLGGIDVTRQLSGGRLAAAVELRDSTLPLMQAEIDLAAAQLASRFEAQGLRLFTDGAGTVPDPTLPYAGSTMVGFASAIRVNPGVVANVTLVRDGTHAVVGSPTGPSDFTPNPSGGPAGFTTLLDRLIDWTFGAEQQLGVPQPGFASTGLGPDGSLVSTLSGLATLESYASALVTAQTGEHATAEANLARAESLRQVLADRVAERSGVDVDKEVASMVQLQTAYGVNAQVIATVQAMWDALFGAVR